MSSPYESLPGFDTPEAAALCTFPPQHVRVVATRSDGIDAFVLLDTGSKGQPYHYGVWCHYRAGRWHEGGSSNGFGWLPTESGSGLGMMAYFDDAPVEADMVRAEYRGQIVEEAVVDGAYLIAWFNCPYDDDWPRTLAFRIAGEWRPHRGWP